MKFTVEKECPQVPTFVTCHTSKEFALGLVVLSHDVTHCFIQLGRDLHVVPVKMIKESCVCVCTLWKNDLRFEARVEYGLTSHFVMVVEHLAFKEWVTAING